MQNYHLEIKLNWSSLIDFELEMEILKGEVGLNDSSCFDSRPQEILLRGNVRGICYSIQAVQVTGNKLGFEKG